MFTYRARSRHIKFDSGSSPTFPGEATIRFHLLPPEPFGTSKSSGHAAVKGGGASIFFNANTGHHHLESKNPLIPLETTIVEPDARIELRGQVLTILRSFETADQLAVFIETFYFLLPLLLNLQFADTPFVDRIDGEIAGSSFRWELQQWKSRFEITDQANQEQALVRSWKQIDVVTIATHRRLLAAIAYFYNGTRLLQMSHAPGEFVSEAILNFSKVLEVLFPGAPQETIKSARAGLISLGYSGDELEYMYVPAIALRNRIDVGHVDLTVFEPQQLQVIHEYAEDAAGFFKELLQRALARIADGSFAVTVGEASLPEREDVVLIERLRAAKAKRAV